MQLLGGLDKKGLQGRAAPILECLHLGEVGEGAAMLRAAQKGVGAVGIASLSGAWASVNGRNKASRVVTKFAAVVALGSGESFSAMVNTR